MRRYEMDVSGNRFVVDVEELSSDTFVVELDGERFEVSVADALDLAQPAVTPSHTARPVVLNQPPARDTGGPAITAPLPGLVVSVDVTLGANVERGQSLVTLEAMKMRNSIRSPRDGVVIAVHVAQGDSVGYGAPLVEVGPR